MKRRDLLVAVGGAFCSSLGFSAGLCAEKRPLIGFLMGIADDQEAVARIKAFEDGLRNHGLTPGRDIQIEYRFSSGSPARMSSSARELLALKPAIIVGHSTPVVQRILQSTRSIPVVFVVVADPVGSNFVESFPKPGSNATGFTNLNATITGKLLTILKQIKPGITHVGAMLNPDTGVSAGAFYLKPFEKAALSYGLKPLSIPVYNETDIQRGLTSLSEIHEPGLVVMPDNFLTVHRKLIISLANGLRIPAVYPYRYFVEEGGLVSYGVDVIDLFRRAADYVSRILEGQKPADLPVQAPTKFELSVNMATAKALGMPIQTLLLMSANVVVE